MNLTSMVHANFTWRPVPSERLQKTMKLAFLQFIDDDCCVLPGMLAGVVGIHAKPKKDCHSSGHPHHATVWAKHQHHNTDKFLRALHTKTKDLAMSHPQDARNELRVSVPGHITETQWHLQCTAKFRDPTLRPPGSAQSAVLAWPGNTYPSRPIAWWHCDY